MKKIALALAFLASLLVPAAAQISQGTVNTDIQTIIPDNTTGQVTPASVRSILNVLSQAIYQVQNPNGGMLYVNTTGQPSSNLPGSTTSPLTIWSNPGAATAGAGTNAGCRIIVGTPASFTNPGLNDIVACTIYVDNLNGRCSVSGCWDLSFVNGQQPVSGGGGGQIMHGSECGTYANIAVADITNPMTTGSAIHCYEMVANSNGLNVGGSGNANAAPPTTAGWCWSADSTQYGTGSNTAPVTWWATCLGLSRAIYAGITAIDYTGDAASQSFQKAVLWDRSSSAYIIKDGPNPVNASTPHTGIFDLTQSAGLGIFANQGSNALLYQAGLSVGNSMSILKNTTAGGDVTISTFANTVAKAVFGYGGATNSWLVFSNPLNQTVFSINLATGAPTMSAIPTSAGGGGLYICVDTSGNFYKKSACP